MSKFYPDSLKNFMLLRFHRFFYEDFIIESVHFMLRSIKFWDRDIEYFLNLDFLVNFDVRTKNRLRNILKKNIKYSSVLWPEIEKMIAACLVGFSEDLIYKSLNYFNFSLLSRFLFKLYLVEFDLYILKLVKLYSLKKAIYKKPFFVKSYFDFYKENLMNYMPLKLDSFLIFRKNMNLILINKNETFENYYKNHFACTN